MIRSTIVTSKDGVQFSVVLDYPTAAEANAAEALERSYAGHCTADELKPLENCGDYHRVNDKPYEGLTIEFTGPFPLSSSIRGRLRIIQGDRD
jgi:hypothetical protein